MNVHSHDKLRFERSGNIPRVSRAVDYIMTRQDREGKTMVLMGTRMGDQQSLMGTRMGDQQSLMLAASAKRTPLTPTKKGCAVTDFKL